MLHLLPHWNWAGREGQEIDVRVFTNMDSVELLLNGRSLGEKAVPRNSHAAWSVVYDPGCLEARGFRGGQLVTTSRVDTAGKPVRLVVSADRPHVKADGEDVVCVAVSALDEKGRHVPLADDLVRFSLDGPGRILGVGNGDPSSHESDQAPLRRLFNGWCMAIVQAGRESGTLVLTARADGLQSAEVRIETATCGVRPWA